MEEPKSLESLFSHKIFRIPDYQRGYAWQHDQLRYFWEDLINLSGDKEHYTGVLTLKQIPDSDIDKSSKEFWLVDEHPYHVYNIVDGQQRLTTFIIFLQALVDFLKALPENIDNPNKNIYVTENLSVADLESRYLFKTKPTGDEFRTYKFGYVSDNPSYNYLRFRLLGEDGGGCVEESFYTLNLSFAKIYFTEQFQGLYEQENFDGLKSIYKKLTKRFLFNEYIIKEEFDVFVAFETMNNRGRKLSALELLKNRLIYLTTLYDDMELDDSSRTNLRYIVNDAWKEIYKQLGRNKSCPLDDDDFLRAHWIMYFQYSRKTGQDYIRFLLDKQFTPKKVHQKIEREVENPVKMFSEQDNDGSDDENRDSSEEVQTKSSAQLDPKDIRDFVNSLKESAGHWFNSFYPYQAENMSVNEQQWIDRLNRIGIGYFRPLVMAVLKKERNEDSRIKIFQQIERFIFIVFRMNSAMGNYGSSDFYNAARAFDRGEITMDSIIEVLNERLSYTLNDDKSFRYNDFYNNLFKKFKARSGYYGWAGIRYFLYEYETSLLSASRQKKVEWNDLLKTEKDKISIEHIYPQTETVEWLAFFDTIEVSYRDFYRGTIGNLLLLSMSINTSLQNDCFNDKKCAKFDSAGKKIRNGYSDGSHSEIEVSQYPSWGPDEIKTRGIKLMKFMQDRWSFSFKNAEELDQMLFLNFGDTTEQ
jgi:hypothetical protein